MLSVAAQTGNAALPIAESGALSQRFTTASDIEALIAKAKATISPDQPALFQPVLRFAPYRASLEYRQARAPAALHRDDAEYFQVVRGSGDLIEGGELVEAVPGEGPNISAKAIRGGIVRHVATGDVFVVPQGVPHQFDNIEGALVMITMKVPRASTP